MKINAPLNALRAFETAARTGSFTSAANELGVSPPAVSQQVKLLEEFWQQKLFIRQGNRLSLTDAGLAAYPQLAQAMGSLAALSSKMQSDERRQPQLVLSAPHSVVETWLPRKLVPVLNDENYAPVDVRIDDDPIDFVRDKIDMRIFFGHDLYGDYQIRHLFKDTQIAVASADFVERFGRDVYALPEQHFIHTDWGSGFASSPNWEAVLTLGKNPSREQGMTVRSSSTALNFVRAGFGVALIPAAMVADDLSARRIVQMDVSPVAMPRGYRIAYPKRLRSHPVVIRTLNALMKLPEGSEPELQVSRN